MAKGLTTILEITQTHVKLAQASSVAGGRVLVFLGAKEIKETSAETVTKAIKGLVSESRIKFQDITCVIGRGSVIVRNFNLPSQEPAEIENMLDFQIKQQIPYAKEDIISDYVITTKNKNGYSDILLVTAHKDVIDWYLKILSPIDIYPDFFSLSSVGISKWYGLYLSSLKKATSEVALLINIDSSVADLCFCSNENLIFSRSISFGLNDLNIDKIEGFLEQMHLTLSTYRKEKNNPEVSKIILLTQSEKAAFLPQKLNLEFSLPVEIINPINSIPKNKNVSAMQIPSNLSFTAVLGLAIAQKEDDLNLLPQDIRQRQKIKYFNKEAMFSGSLLILAILLILGSVSINIYKKEQYLKQLDIKLKDVAPVAKGVEDKTRKLELVKEYWDYSVSPIDIIYELYNVLPSSMSLNVFNLDEKGNLTLQGVSSRMSDIFSFQSVLEKTKIFRNVEVKYASKRNTSQGEITDFRVTCQIENK